MFLFGSKTKNVVFLLPPDRTVLPFSLQLSSAKNLSLTVPTQSASKNHGCVMAMTTAVTGAMRRTASWWRTHAVIQSFSARPWTACASICRGNVMVTLTARMSRMKSIVSFVYCAAKILRLDAESLEDSLVQCCLRLCTLGHCGCRYCSPGLLRT